VLLHVLKGSEALKKSAKKTWDCLKHGGRVLEEGSFGGKKIMIKGLGWGGCGDVIRNKFLESREES